MEESGSEGLDELIFAQKDKFFKDVDYVCISDNYWLGKKKPCITYGLRGICYFFIEVRCSHTALRPANAQYPCSIASCGQVQVASHVWEKLRAAQCPSSSTP